MSNSKTCQMCKKKKDYGIWVTSGDKPVLYCLECQIKRMQERENESNSRIQPS